MSPKQNISNGPVDRLNDLALNQLVCIDHTIVRLRHFLDELNNR